MPENLSSVFEDSEAWMNTVVQASMLIWLSQINLASPSSAQKNQNYWTFAANVCSLSTLELMLSGVPNDIQGTAMKMAHSALDAVA